MYTVEADGAPLVVQSRSPENALDIELIRHAQTAYGSRFVPCPRYLGSLAKLYAYSMDNVRMYAGGVSVYLARDELRANGNRLLKVAIEDFAQFLAMPWHNTSPDSTDNNTAAPDRPPAVRQLRADLEQLRIGLPARFRPTLEGLLQALPSLLFPDDGWPMVPNHADLLENNIHVDPETGRRLRLEGRHRRPVRHIPLGGSRACSAGTPRPLAGAGCTAPRRCAPASGPPSRTLQGRAWP
ncbi:hypothetical protein ISF_02346 [Cordyceps fumosorosea ARSEF 2679]|uniref:Aminoglycoside phosphotransferase n=1 Tax=Cordyceps fumosorosea (strain ARSEF 2679) TaxID=1081104 RepID=A0A162JKM9_CORFA|nr:hypothetical protein ISF_02346 [Cordyceps fumosorosea ARSEF 2679]OAA70372.1 hypothetical protein ISF_02346 [Cordyceps fumosorosea ARSEF 2679]